MSLKIALVLAVLAATAACTNTSQPGPVAPGPAAPTPAASAPAAPPSAAKEAAKSPGYEGGDGLSCESRVIIRGATGSANGVPMEYAWIKQKYPGFRMRQQSLRQCAGKPADVLDITTAEGKDLSIYFDISDFFGKEFGLGS